MNKATFRAGTPRKERGGQMRRFLTILPVLFAILTAFGPVWAASEEAMKLRTQNGLIPFEPSESFLNGNFVADEIEPQFVFGKVVDFSKARSCRTSWLIEESETKRIKSPESQTGPIEYTLYLEEDCPGKVVYYVFVDRSRAKSADWMEWRKLFHKSKVEQQYAATNAALEQAAEKGFSVNGELRFIEIKGELVPKKAEDYLTGDMKVKPVYNLRQATAPK
jgi:hypothetical protein